jgi:hypothetical protein
MLRTVDEYREWYRRRLLVILGRIRAGLSPSGDGRGAAWRTLLAMAARLLGALVVVGGVLLAAAYVMPLWDPLTSPPLSAGRPLSWPESAAPDVSEPRSFYTVERGLADYMLLEGHARRGLHFAILVHALDLDLQEGRLALSEEQVRSMLGPPDRVSDGPPRVWGYLFDRMGCKDTMVLVEFRDGAVARFGYADPASLPPQEAPPPADAPAPAERPATPSAPSGR